MVPSGFTVPGWQEEQSVEVGAWLAGGWPWQLVQPSGPPVHEKDVAPPPRVAPWQ
jgi:hypothetical protein